MGSKKRVRPTRKPSPKAPLSGRIKKASFERKKLAREFKRLERDGRLANGVVMPVGAVAADLTKQAPHRSWSPPKFYTDLAFECLDCGVQKVWTARQQKWYYEVAKGSIDGTAKRCRACRKKRRDAKSQQKRHMQEMALAYEKKSKR